MGILEGWAGGARERDHDGRQAGRTVGLQARALTAQLNLVLWDTGRGCDRPKAAL